MFHPNGPSLWELFVQAMSSTDRGYDLLAPKFEYTPFRTPQPMLDAVGDAIGPEVARGLDVCCGTGAATRMLRRHCRVVVGLDRSPGMLAEAHRLDALDESPGRATYERGDALTMSFSEPFDVAVSFGAFGHVLDEDLPKFVQNVHDALRSGGRFLFVTWDPPGPTRRAFWFAHGFNAAMHVRNQLWRPPFIMYYLNFLLPRATELCERAGFEVDVLDGRVPHPVGRPKLVVATRR